MCICLLYQDSDATAATVVEKVDRCWIRFLKTMAGGEQYISQQSLIRERLLNHVCTKVNNKESAFAEIYKYTLSCLVHGRSKPSLFYFCILTLSATCCNPTSYTTLFMLVNSFPSHFIDNK